MPSLRSINKEAGTNFRRWKQVAPAIKEGEQAKAEVEVMKAAEPVIAKPAPVPEAAAVKVQEQTRSMEFADHPAIAKALAKGWSLKDVESGRNASRRMAGQVALAQHRHGKDSPEVAEAIDEANRVSVMLTAARAAYNRIRYPERYKGGRPSRNG